MISLLRMVDAVFYTGSEPKPDDAVRSEIRGLRADIDELKRILALTFEDVRVATEKLKTENAQLIQENVRIQRENEELQAAINAERAETEQRLHSAERNVFE
jgi:SMC interacting uncharacterized protein involved in chromosome segregation